MQKFAVRFHYFYAVEFFSDNSISRLSVPIHIYQIFCTPIRHQQTRNIIWALPTPASGIRLDISGYTANADEIRPGHF